MKANDEIFMGDYTLFLNNKMRDISYLEYIFSVFTFVQNRCSRQPLKYLTGASAHKMLTDFPTLFSILLWELDISFLLIIPFA